ncbi:MAG: xylose-responsive transcription regulator, family, partial [Rhodocyclales bacterium]|nr:xylose-responsive transcription regulator, family [Rhodocyclales bacterium]
MAITGDQSFLKNINRMAMIRLIRSQPGLSRADLAVSTGLTKSTISQLVQELVDEGWVSEDAALVTGSLGRRPTPLRLNTERLALIGADLMVGRVDVVATNLTGAVIGCAQRTMDTKDIIEVMAVIADGIAELALQMIAQNRSLLGVGVGVPGPVHAISGVLHLSPNFGWRDVPVRDELRGALALRGLATLPVYVQARAATAALGEVEFASTPVEEPLLYIHLGLSVGAGVFVSDRLLIGHGGFAGGVGNQQLKSDGERRTAEELIGLNAMSYELGISPYEFQARVEANDPSVQESLKQAGHYLGILIHNLWCTFDPAQVVLGGVCSRFGGVYINSALETLNAR